MTNDIPDVAGALADLARAMTDKPDLEATLGAVTAAATSLIAGADAADILLISSRKHFRSHAATSDLPLRLDSLQEASGQGPCIDAARGEQVISSDDLTREDRWPDFAPQAVQAGVHSTLCFQLYAGGGALGALNLFGRVPRAFTAADVETGAMLATHAAIALHSLNKSEQFHSALASRDLIGQAKGMIMERFSIDAVQAFELLRRLSQDSNVPLAQIAAQLVDQGSATTS